MSTKSSSQTPPEIAAHLEVWEGSGNSGVEHSLPKIVLICEHASNQFEEPWEQQLKDSELHTSHAASDPGALGLARELGPCLEELGGRVELIHAPFSRLMYDLNRSPDRPDAYPEQSELYAIPFNVQLSSAERLRRVEHIYIPFHNFVRARIAHVLASGERPIVVSIHSFSPTWYGAPRSLEFGVIHDVFPDLATQIVANSAPLGLVTALNEPYSAKDHVTHTLKLHAVPYGLANAMIEIRNDLLATVAAQKELAQGLSRILIKSIIDTMEQVKL